MSDDLVLVAAANLLRALLFAVVIVWLAYIFDGPIAALFEAWAAGGCAEGAG